MIILHDERWLPLADPTGRDEFHGYYVSDLGNVLSCRRGRRHVLRTWTQSKGYNCVTLSLGTKGQNRTFLVHALVLTAFVGPCPDGEESRHKDGDKKNNRLENLEWGTPRQNHADKQRHGTDTIGERNGRAKLSEDDVRDIRRKLSLGYSGESLARSYFVTGPTISDIKHRVTWRTVIGILAVVSVSSPSCRAEEKLTSTVCDAPCFDGPPARRWVGACRDGTPTCDDGEFVACEGDVLPSSERCDGLDNDCDGRVDELELPCGTDVGECEPGLSACVEGAEVCEGEVAPSAEVCNGRDDDCNGSTDDVPLSFCYEGDPEAALHPPCRAGVSICLAGSMACFGQVSPTWEICNGVDDDCNGLVDDVDGEVLSSFDVVVVIDRSASMGDELPDVSEGLLEFATFHAGDPTIRYAVVELAGDSGRPSPRVVFDLSSVERIVAYLPGLVVGDGAIEASYDAFTWVSDGTFPLSWAAGSKRILIFVGDEEGQSNANLDEEDAAAAAVAARVVFVGFVDPFSFDDYDQIADRTGGLVLPLRGVEDMDLGSIFVTVTSTVCR